MTITVEEIRGYIYPENEDSDAWWEFLPLYQLECVKFLLSEIDRLAPQQKDATDNKT